MPTFILEETTSQHSNITRILQRNYASLFDTDLVSFNFIALDPTGC